MGNKTRIVISASRRTDIPAFYMPWFLRHVEKGTIRIVNPYNRHQKDILLSPRHVHSIVFWSKNFGPFIFDGYGEQLATKGFHLFFNFTVNSESSQLEPHVPPLGYRMEQLKRLCAVYGPEVINWRFDPICFYETSGGVRHNLGDFKRIAQAAADLGIRRCITSFWDDYPKIRKRTRFITNFRLIDPPLEKKTSVLIWMATYLKELGIRLYTCCEKEVLEALPPDCGIDSAACIDHRRLATLFEKDVSQKSDTGQRVKLGCRCQVAVDVGDYRQHPCYHNCLFCYANPSKPPREEETVPCSVKGQ